MAERDPQLRAQAVALMRAGGCRWARIILDWLRVQPTPARPPDFSSVDGVVDEIRTAGCEPIVCFLGIPPWASGVEGSRYHPPRDLRLWKDCVKAAVRHFKGRVRHWETWNETDISTFSKGTQDEAIALAGASYDAVKGADPQSVVLTSGLDGLGEGWLAEALSRGYGETGDVIAAHPYGGTPARVESHMRILWRTLHHYDIHRPVWVTEVGFQSGGWKGGSGVTPDEQSKACCLRETMERLRKYAEVVCWYRADEPGRMYGLVATSSDGLQVTPAYEAFGRAARPGLCPSIRAELVSATGKVVAGGKWTGRVSLTNDAPEATAVALIVCGLPSEAVRLEPPEVSVPANGKAEIDVLFEPPACAPARSLDYSIVCTCDEGRNRTGTDLCGSQAGRKA